MTLPTSRNYTQTAAAPIQSSLINGLQDQIVGMKRPAGWRWVQTNAVPPIVGGSWASNVDGIICTAASTFDGLGLGWWEEGTRIIGLGVMYLGTGVAVTPAFVLKMNTGNGAPATLGTLTFVNPPAAWGLYTLTLGVPQVLPVHASLYLAETASLPVSQKLGLVGIQSDRL